MGLGRLRRTCGRSSMPDAETSLPKADAGGRAAEKGSRFGGWSLEVPSNNSVWEVSASWVPEGEEEATKSPEVGGRLEGGHGGQNQASSKQAG